LKFVVKANPHM